VPGQVSGAKKRIIRPAPSDAGRQFLGKKSLRSQANYACNFTKTVPHEHPVVDPHVSHFMQVPLRTSVKLPHSPQASPS
jgi:hypothetical protein